MAYRYPFSAVVGQDQLRLALILCAIVPGIGGVLIRGEKGTAKTTTVRAFAALLPDAPLVDLPIGATEDRVVGSLDLESILTQGKAQYQKGLLAQAHGGVLYVDEVNLLADHLVDVLLDAAATGSVTIERDGISHSADAKFILVGTMNPEEGELRPQLLDRFGLSVEVTASREVDTRVEIMRRRLAFDEDPQGFIDRWAKEDTAIAADIAAARDLLPQVVVDDEVMRTIAHLCAHFDVDGMRADLVVARASQAHAAWRGSTTITEEDIRVAATLALPHRKRRNPFDEPGMDQQELDDAFDAQPQDDNGPTDHDAPESEEAQNTPGGEDRGFAEQGAPFRR